MIPREFWLCLKQLINSSHAISNYEYLQSSRLAEARTIQDDGRVLASR